MNNAANKVWTKIKGLNVTITGKIKLGFIEIAVAVPRNISRLWQEPVFCLAFYSSVSSSNGKNKKNDGMKKLNLECTAKYHVINFKYLYTVGLLNSHTCASVGKDRPAEKSIFARTFRGELSTNAPTEESVVELLKSIF